MMTLRQFSAGFETVPSAAMWYIADLGEARGKQELFTRQSPQRLKALREHALIESAVSSNRIEGVEIDKSRIGTVIFGKPLLRDRNEEEIRGYREALKLIHESGSNLPVSEETILSLHQLARGQIWDAGKYKKKDGDIIEKYSDGTSRIRFKTLPASKTSAGMKELLSIWEIGIEEHKIHPLILIAAFNLDFLCIHPFRDGNGRVSRLLLLLQCYHLGYEAGRYISIERLIEQNKDRYYETLQESSEGWHKGRHNPWLYINYILYILKTAYKEFERRVGETIQPHGAKAEIVLEAIENRSGEFRLTDIEHACPGVSREWIRTLLAQLRERGDVICRGKGPAARWHFKGRKQSKGTTSK